MSTSLRTKNPDHANLIIHQDLITDVVKLTDRVMAVVRVIDKTLVVDMGIDNFGSGQDNRHTEYRVNPQKDNSQTDKKGENVGSGRGRARPLKSEVTTNQSSIQGRIGVSSAAQEAGK